MNKQKYLKLLKDPRWQKKRLEIFQRDNFQCRICGDKEETLHVHHKIYIGDNPPWKSENKDLLTVCSDCHNLISNNIILDTQKIFYKRVRQEGVTYFVLTPHDMEIHYRNNEKEVIFIVQLSSYTLQSILNQITSWRKDEERTITTSKLSD